MKQLSQEGFTLIEIILFLALSGLFLMIAFAGIGGRNQAVQFTDSMRSLHSSLQSENTQLINGVNSDSTPPLGCGDTDTDACVLLGKVIKFNDGTGTIDTRVLYGDYLDLEDYELGDIELLAQARPRDAEANGSHEIKWGTFFTGVAANDPPLAGSIDRIGLMRSPGSARIIPIVYNSGVSLDLQANYNVTSPNTKLDGDVNTYLCFEGVNGQVAAITFGSEGGNAKIDLEFDKLECQP